MTAPRFELVRTGKEPFNVGRIIPIYPATADLTSDQLRKLIWETLHGLEPSWTPCRARLSAGAGTDGPGGCDPAHPLSRIRKKTSCRPAAGSSSTRSSRSSSVSSIASASSSEPCKGSLTHGRKPDSLAETFVAELPFKLTGAQRHACDEVADDLAQSYPMHRLVEGEVGSGKTVVALYACLIAIEGGHQAAFMAPTEVLAEQHHLTVGELLDRAFGEAEGRNLFADVSKRPVVRLLTGSTPAAQREQILAEVATGEVRPVDRDARADPGVGRPSTVLVLRSSTSNTVSAFISARPCARRALTANPTSS